MIAALALSALAWTGPGVHLAPSVAPCVVAADGAEAPAAKPDKSSAVAVSVTTKDQLLISGSYWAPKGKGKAPGALLLHAAGSSRVSLDELGESLHKKGFAVLSIDLRGHGQSVSDSADWAKATDDKARETLWGLAARDVDAAAQFLLGRSEVQTTNLSVFGVGSGCALALRQVQSNDNARALVLITPEAESFGYNLAQAVEKLGGLPTLILASNKAKDVAERLRSAGHAANDGIEFIELSLVRAEPAEVLADKKLNSSAATWLRSQVMPKD